MISRIWTTLSFFADGERARTAILLWGCLLAALLASAVTAPPAAANSRIKDIIDFEGVRDNVLVGYGLVVGLNGTGDDLTNSAFTKQSLTGMLERLGVNTRDVTLKTQNVAAVMVTATLPSFTRQGTRIDVAVSALGDASSLQGGTLLVTPLVGADGEVYAVAQGQVATGGFKAAGKAASVTKNVPTSARIPNGAIVEREISFKMQSLSRIRLSLRNPDLTTARRVTTAINRFLKTSAAFTTDPGTIQLHVPPKYTDNVVALLTDVEQIRIAPDQPARVVVDEQNGVIVIGENVRINPSLTVIKEFESVTDGCCGADQVVTQAREQQLRNPEGQDGVVIDRCHGTILNTDFRGQAFAILVSKQGDIRAFDLQTNENGRRK